MTAIEYSFADGVATISLCNADRGNPVTQEMVDEFAQAVRRARADDARVVLLSALGFAFSVGGDVSAFADADDVGVMIDDLAESLHRVISELNRMDAIIVTAVQGVAAGAGVSLAACGDIVLAADSAKFTLAYTKVGLSPDGGSSMLTASIGLHRALHLALLNPVLSAVEAQQGGLVAQVHPSDTFADAVQSVVAVLRTGSRTAQVSAKRLLREQAVPAPELALRRESLSIRACAVSPDGREGVRAFLDKRPPAFPSTTDSVVESPG